MILKNVTGQGIYLFAYTSTGPKTGDAANITGYSSIDGATTGTAFGTANPTEISATNLPGVYWQPLAKAETNGSAIAYSWKSATSGVSIDPIIALTTGVNLPTAAPGAAGGMFIAGTNAATTVTTSFTTTFTGSLTGSVNSVATAVVLPSIPNDWITAAGIAPSAVAEIQAGLSTYAGGDTSGVTTLLSRLTAGRATNLDRLDVAISTIPDAAANADKMLGRNIAGGSDGGRTVAQAMAFLRNKWVISAGTMTVYETNDSSVSWTSTVTTTASNPVTGSDPA